MNHNLSLAVRRHGLALLLVGAALLVLPATAGAQPVRLFFWPEAKPPENPDRGHYDLPLRPNVTQEFFLFLYNGGKDLKTIGVELRAGGKAVAAAKLDNVPAGIAQRVIVPSPAPPAPAAGAVAAAEPPKLLELAGEVVAVALLDNKEVARATVRVGHPSEFVQYSAATFDREARTLSVSVTADAIFSGPPARVDLDLRPERIPFLAPKQKPNGTYGGFLDGPKARLDLEAHDLRLQPSTAPTFTSPGLAYLTIDGYERAFTFRVTNVSEKLNELRRLNTPILHLIAPPLAATGEPTKVRFEADYLPTGSRIELGLYRDDSFAPQKLDGKLLIFPSERKQSILFSPQGPSGGLLFETKVTDWSVGLDTKKVYGGRILRMRLLDPKNQPLTFTEALDNGTLREGRMQITAGMVLDGTPPEDVKFVDFPAELVRGTPLTVKVTGRDPESDIKKVVFYVGKVPTEGPIPPTMVPVAGTKVKNTDVWVADLPAPTDKAGTFDVTAHVTNGVGLTEPAYAVIKLVDAKPGPVLATIKGKVVEGDRPQEKIGVVLRDPQGVVKDSTDTDEKGEFIFRGVAPGTYQIVATKISSKTTGTAAVTVAPGDEKVLKDPISLTR